MFVTARCSLMSPTFNSVKVVFFVHCRLAKTTLSSLTVAAKLQFEESEFSIEWTVGGSFWKHQVVGQLDDISSVGIVVEGVRFHADCCTCFLLIAVGVE